MAMGFKLGLNKPSITLALCTKFCLGFLLLSVFNGFHFDAHFHTFESGDTEGYLDPPKNLLAHGTWAIDINEPETCATRPPLYGLVYLPLRAVAPERAADLLLVVLQLAASAFAALMFAETVRLICLSDALAWVAFAFALLSFQLLCYDLRLLPESFAVSAAIAANYYLVRDKLARPSTSVVIGMLLVIVVILIPYLGLIFPVLGAVLLFVHGKEWRLVARHGAGLFLPFAFAFSAWSAWIFPHVGRLVIFQTSFPAAYKSARAYFDFVQSWGGDTVFWNPDSAAGWFSDEPESRDYRFPAEIFEGQSYSLESLKEAKALMMQSGLRFDSTGYLSAPGYALAQTSLDRFAKEFKARNPFHAAVKAPALIFLKYVSVIQTDTIRNSNFYARSRSLRTAVDVSAVTLNLMLLLGLFAYVFLPRERRAELAPAYAAMLVIVLVVTFYITTMLRRPEGRYALVTLWLAYPWSFAALWGLNRLRGGAVGRT